jgi:hypothetical protein
MVYINIPYIPENNRIDKLMVKKELEALDISDSAKLSAYTAIYNLNPRGVNFDSRDLQAARRLENALHRLGIPYQQTEETDYS